jgi:uncharacterized membrane protein
MLESEPRWRFPLRVLAIVTFILAGLNHFRDVGFYERIIPPGFPTPGLLVAVSGVCEIAGGVGLAIRPLRRAAGWGLIALLVAVFPANIYMAVCPQKFGDLHWAEWMLRARLPLQGVLISWVWAVF